MTEEEKKNIFVPIGVRVGLKESWRDYGVGEQGEVIDSYIGAVGHNCSRVLMDRTNEKLYVCNYALEILSFKDPDWML